MPQGGCSVQDRFSSNTDAKQVDEDLQKVQAFILDAAAPLLELLETEDSKGNLVDAISLLSNAVTQTSKIRRKRILKVCNQDI